MYKGFGHGILDVKLELISSLLNKKIRTEFGKKSTDLVSGRLMLFGDFLDIGTDDKKYVEITDQEMVSISTTVVAPIKV